MLLPIGVPWNHSYPWVNGPAAGPGSRTTRDRHLLADAVASRRMPGEVDSAPLALANLLSAFTSTS